jgi:signal transduction histidine kinase
MSGAVAVRGGWAERALRRTYARRGAPGLLAAYAAINLPLGWAYWLLVLLCGGSVLDAGFADQVTIVGIWSPAVVGAVVLAGWLHRTDFAVVRGWSLDHSAEDTYAAWRACNRLSRFVFTLWCLIVPAAIGFTIQFLARLHRAWWLAGGFTLGQCLAFGALAVIQFYLAEWMVSPVRQDIASHLPRGADAAPGTRTSLSLKLAAPYPAFAALTAVVVYAFADGVDLGREAKFTVVALIMAVSVVVTALVFRASNRVTLGPLVDLKDATERVRSGDFTTRVPVLSTDELGDLASSFNLMLTGLKEREELREELRASRARIVAASDAERRRVERNIHDGAQQQLVALAIKLGMLEERVDAAELKAAVQVIRGRLNSALEELRELARGLHPSVLTTDGLQPALAHLANQATVPVEVDVPDLRFPEMVESTAYFVASEALANVAKYANASRASVRVNGDNGQLIVTVSDDGVGGAHAGAGSGLSGLADRVEALGGRLTVTSPPGEGTELVVELPI